MSDILTCPHCKVRVIPWIVGDGTIAHYRCPQCLVTDETHHWIHRESINKPLGIVDAHYLNKPGHYLPVQRRRTRAGDRRGLNRGRNQKVEVIPPLAGKPDRDLEALLEHGILVNLNDEVPTEDY